MKHLYQDVGRVVGVLVQMLHPYPSMALQPAIAFRAHILRQHSLGVAEVGSWSKMIPVPNCPDKFMCILNRIMA